MGLFDFLRPQKRAAPSTAPAVISPRPLVKARAPGPSMRAPIVKAGEGSIGESSPGMNNVGDGLKLTAARLQEADFNGYNRLRDDRENRRNHLEYYTGRWYGRQSEIKQMRPINLMAQMVQAFVPQLNVNFRPLLRPLRSGLGAEARKLQILVENGLREQTADEEIFEPAIIDALFSPFSTLYTGIRDGQRIMEIDGRDHDPGEPFTMFVEFDDVAVDPNAKDIRHALWFRHRFRIPRQWLLDSPAFAKSRDIIMRLNSFEDEGETESQIAEKMTAGSADRVNPLFDTIELVNFAIYDRGKVYEATLTPKNKGPATFLRFEPYEGPSSGPYDHIAFNRVPGNLPSVSPASVIRDIAEVGDILARKLHEQATRTKKVLGYKGGAEEDAAAIAESADGSAIRMDDPNSAKVFEFNMIAADIVGILAGVEQQYQGLAGNPALLGGTAQESDTLGQDQILNNRAGVRVAFMTRKIVGAISRVISKHCWFYQTDPVADMPVSVPISGVGMVDLRYSALTRKGSPGDFRYDIQIVGRPSADPDLQARRIIEFMTFLGQNMALFLPVAPGLPPLFKLHGTVTKLAPMFGIDDPEEMINDMELLIERQQAEMAADEWLTKANSGAPDLAHGGVQDGFVLKLLSMLSQQGQMGAGGMPGQSPMGGGAPMQPQQRPGMGGGGGRMGAVRPQRPVQSKTGLMRVGS